MSDTELPAVSGEWGYPLAGDYSKGRGFGYHPVEGCSYCKSDHRGYDMDQPCGATVFAAAAPFGAAALDGRPPAELFRWTLDPSIAAEAVAVLTNHPNAATGWADSLGAMIDSDPKTRDSIWQGVSLALSALADPRVLDAVTPREGEDFDPEAFLQQRGTLYLLATGAGAGASASLVAAFVEDLVEAARRLAALPDLAAVVSSPLRRCLGTAERAAEAGIPVSTISFGTLYGTVDIQGRPQPVPVDDASLRTIAELSGGDFFTASTLEELDSVYRTLEEQIGYEWKKADASRPWLIIGSLLAMTAAAGSLTAHRRIP